MQCINSDVTLTKVIVGQLQMLDRKEAHGDPFVEAEEAEKKVLLRLNISQVYGSQW